MSKKFDRLLEAATDSTNLEPNWDGIIACFDSIRSGEVPAKAAMLAMRKRIQHDNPHVVMHALLVLDACVKNCGHKIHAEIATREFMEEFKNLGIGSQYEDVKTKVLEMLQCWAMAFANKPEYKIVVDTHNLMKLAGFDFPSIKEADAMFTAQVAPDWHDGSECFRCRSEFSLFNRKHHCRACGQIFCDRCSTKEIPLPQFGIEKEVRVCDACFEKISSKVNESKVVKNEPLTSTSVKEDIPQAEKEKLLKEKEEEDLALALAISQSEAEAKEQERQKSLYAMYNGDTTGTSAVNDAASLSSYNPSEMGYKGAAPSIAESPSDNLAVDDPLARYLNRDYWQQRKAGASAKVSLFVRFRNLVSYYLNGLLNGTFSKLK
nr:VHS and Zinc finger and Ubiquitin interacting motif domain containing protein [Haemonchus contortus]